MKGERIFPSVLVLGLLLALVAGVTLAQDGPQGVTAPADMVDSAFTYQGRLTDGGSPANGTYDFEFKLYDDASIGSQVGSTVTADDVTVSDGLFTVQLDFGDVFDGMALWLKIGVRDGGSSGAYTPLSPRQPLTAAPYALSLRPGTTLDASLGTAVFHVENRGSGMGIWGYSQDNRGVYGSSGSDSGVYGSSQTGAGVYGFSALGSGVYGTSDAIDGHGVHGEIDSLGGYAGYFSNNMGGVDIMAAGSGIIKSEADSVLYLSPHDMVVRGSSGVDLTFRADGGVDIASTSGVKYLSIPVSTFGTLFGAPLYVKGIEVCYNKAGSAYIDITAVTKNNGSSGGVQHYIYNTTDRSSATYSCYTVTDSTPAPIDNSTWVQFNISFYGTGSIYIYTVKLTLTETP